MRLLKPLHVSVSEWCASYSQKLASSMRVTMTTCGASCRQVKTHRADGQDPSNVIDAYLML
jgi:hypothetical protein